MEVVVQFGERANRAGARMWNSLSSQAGLADGIDEYSFESVFRRDKRVPRMVAFGTASSRVEGDLAMEDSAGACKKMAADAGHWRSDVCVPLHGQSCVELGTCGAAELDAALDAVRAMVEEADALTGGLRVFADADDVAMAALCERLLPEAADEFCPPAVRSVVLFGGSGAPTERELRFTSFMCEQCTSTAPVALFGSADVSPYRTAALFECVLSPSVIRRISAPRESLLYACAFSLGDEEPRSVYGAHPWVSQRAFSVLRDERDPLYVSDADDASCLRVSTAVLLYDCACPSLLAAPVRAAAKRTGGELRESLEHVADVLSDE